MSDSSYFSKIMKFKLGDKGTVALNIIIMCSFLFVAMKIMTSDKKSPVTKEQNLTIQHYSKYL